MPYDPRGDKRPEAKKKPRTLLMVALGGLYLTGVGQLLQLGKLREMAARLPWYEFAATLAGRLLVLPIIMVVGALIYLRIKGRT